MVGILLGYVSHYAFVKLLSGLLGQELAPASVWPAIYGFGVGMTLLIAFGLPPVLQLARVSPLRVLRREVGGVAPLAFSVLLMGLLGFVVLLLMMGGNLLLGALTVGSFAIAGLFFALLAFFMVKILRPLADLHTLPIGARLAIRGMTANPKVLVTQVSALSLGMLALVLLFLLRTDLVESWQELVPEDAPNRFVINVMPDQADAFEGVLKKAGVKNYDWYPMILGRLMMVNDKPVQLDDYDNDQSKRLVDREFSLSYMAHYPAHNRIVEGQWVDNEPDAVSVEAGLMKSLGLKLGDRLTFSVGGTEYSGKITSVRELEWSSMHVNFFVIFTQKEMAEASKTYIAAFKAPDNLGFDNALAQDFPNITAINLSSVLLQIQTILEQVIKAIEFIFAFTLIAGLVVLYAAIASTREQRTHDFAVMRALGAGNALLKKVQRIELMGTGAIAGFLAALVALAISGILVVFVFNLPWQPTLWVPFLGALLGLLLAWFTGWLSLRSVLKRPVVETLRAVLD
ncbi:MAG: ABC transporter permease, partial [Saezia sp.]